MKTFGTLYLMHYRFYPGIITELSNEVKCRWFDSLSYTDDMQNQDSSVGA